MNETNIHERVLEIIDGFDTAMLTSHTLSGQIRARPMHIAGVEDDGHIWFVSSSHSGKIEEFERDARVAVVLQGSRRYVSITGQALLVDDPVRLEEMWKKTWEVWFPNGPRSDDVQLLSVRPEIAEYWDTSGTAGVKYAVAAARALATGEAIDPNALEHGKTRL